ncbi:MAG: sigma-70 family RNA polymerase sigma factor [Thermomicrobia bacterium]|nr:sigma-70 family RNA polymerase sigma factor [Thermomicrobia bacterium]
MSATIAARSLRPLDRPHARLRAVPALEASSDERLIFRIRSRDENALATLYTRYVDVIYSLALRIVRNPEVAEEIAQETFMRVWRGAYDFHGNPSGARAWLFCIGRNLALDQLRRQAARPRTIALMPDSADDRAPLDRLADERCDVAMQATDYCLREQLRRALLTLPPEQRHVLECAYFGGLTHREIAEAMDEPLGTIKTRVRLGLQKLAAIAQQERFER